MTTDTGAFPAPLEAAFTSEEQNVVKARLFALLAKQARRRTQGDHSSLREEDAAELLDSLQFTLRWHLHEQGMPLRKLLTADLDELLFQGQAALRVRLNVAETLYQIAVQRVATFGSRALSDTLTGVGQFFCTYDLSLYAHRIPAPVDYQLCLPVEERFRGVTYIQAYLERLLIENTLMTRFPQDRITALLSHVSPDYRELLINLYEPVAASAVGLKLLGCDITPLAVTCAQAADIFERLSVLPPDAAQSRMAEAADAVCAGLRLPGIKHAAYLRQTAETLLPRIRISRQSAAGVFSACL
jgi:hypothetical protein